MNVPDELAYTSDHEWAALGNGSVPGGKVRVGITDYAQDALGDIVFIQLPELGTKVEAGGSLGEIESTKSVSDIYAPVSGEIVELNETLTNSPELLNEDPYGKGWICVIETTAPSDTETLLDAGAYRDLILD